MDMKDIQGFATPSNQALSMTDEGIPRIVVDPVSTSSETMPPPNEPDNDPVGKSPKKIANKNNSIFETLPEDEFDADAIDEKYFLAAQLRSIGVEPFPNAMQSPDDMMLDAPGNEGQNDDGRGLLDQGVQAAYKGASKGGAELFNSFALLAGAPVELAKNVINMGLDAVGMEPVKNAFGDIDSMRSLVNAYQTAVNDVIPVPDAVVEWASQPYDNEIFAGFVEAGTQFAVGAVPAAKLVKAMTTYNAAARGFIWGAIADFTAMSPDDPILADNITEYLQGLPPEEQMPILQSFVEVIAKNETDPEFVKRAKMALEGGAIGTVVEGAIRVAKFIPFNKIVEASKRAGGKIVDAADARIAERQADTSVTLGAGVDPMPMIDEAISAAGKAMQKKNLAATDNPISIDLPEIDPDILIGKKIFPIQADLTKAGGSFKGVDSSLLDEPIPLQGGPDFPLLQTSADGQVVWAVDAKAVTSKKLGKDADYAVVMAMSPRAHKTNATVIKSLTDTAIAYARDGRMTAEAIAEIDAVLQSASVQPALRRMPEFPGLASPDATAWMRDASFEERNRIAQVLSSPMAQDKGAPNVQMILDETSEGAYTGMNINDSIMIIKIDKDAGAVELGKEPGTVPHHSYKYALKGEPVGRLSMVNVQNLFPDWFSKQAPIWEQKQKAFEAGEMQKPPNKNRAFQFQLPVETMTAEKIAKIKRLKVESIKSPLQAKLTAQMMDGQWSSSNDTLLKGGTNALAWVREARSSKEGITLSIPKGDAGERLTDAQAAAVIQKEIKSGNLTLYKLGKDSRTFFGIQKNYNYDEVYEGWKPTPGGPEIGDNEVALVSVLSNDRAANGIGKATVLKAIEEGATVLDCFEVKSARNPDGFLTNFYGMFDFVEAGRVEFDPQYYSKQEIADLEKVWSDRGWKQGDPYPDVVIMKYIGDDNARSNATKRFVTEGNFSSGADQTGDAFGNAASNVQQSVDQTVTETGLSSGSNTRRRADRDLRDGDRGTATDRLALVAQEILSLTDEQIQNLGLDAAQISRLKTQYQTGSNAATVVKKKTDVDALLPEITRAISRNTDRNAKKIARDLRQEGLLDVNDRGQSEAFYAEFERIKSLKGERKAAKPDRIDDLERNKNVRSLKAKVLKAQKPIKESPMFDAWTKPNRERVLDSTYDNQTIDAEARLATVEAIAREAKKRGLKVYYTSKMRQGRTSSRYIELPDGGKVRVSDHELPDTAQRRYTRSEGIGNFADEIIVSDWKTSSVDDYLKRILGEE